MANKLNFKFGDSTKYESLGTPEDGTIYAVNDGFTEGGDTKMGSIYKGDKIIGTTVADKLVVPKKITVAGLPANSPFAGIKNGDSIEAGTNLAKILMDMLSKELNPGAPTLPSVTISGPKSLGTLEIGASVSIPAVSMDTVEGKFNDSWGGPQPAPGTTFSNQTITPSGQVGFTDYSPVAGTSIEAGTGKIVIGTNKVTMTATADYSAPANKPHTNLGNEYNGAEATWTASTTPASKVGNFTATGVYPVYSNNASGGLTTEVNTRASLTAGNSVEISFGSELSSGNFVAFSHPSTHTITKVEVYNTMSNKYETYGGGSTDVAEGSKRTINGTEYQYNVWTRQGDNKNDAIKFRFTLSKGLNTK
jgi:hypothetical protein